MRVNSTFRLAVTVLTFALGLLLLHDKRSGHPNKQRNKVSEKTNAANVSNTDFIFFESLSRHLFVSLQ